MYVSRKGLEVRTVDCYNPLPNRVEGKEFSYSDHEAVCSKLRILPTETAEKVQEPVKEILEEALELCQKALDKLLKDRLVYWLLFATVLVLLCALPDFSSWVVYYPLVFLRLMSILTCAYCCIMATIWNRIERHGIRAAILSLTTRLEAVTGRYVKEPFSS